MRLQSSRHARRTGGSLPSLSDAGRLLLGSLTLLLFAGCGAMHPDRGIPVQAVSAEWKVPPKGHLRPIDLSLLRQNPPCEHRVDSGDVLGIYVEGILGSKDEVPPVHVSPCDREIPPSTGYPIPVRSDGTIALPLADPISVRGMTFREVEQKLRWVYTQQRPLLRTGQERILVGLQRPRVFRILVLRQEAGNAPVHQGFGATQVSHTEKRGVGRAILLPAYRNDVLNALAETGGLPGLDAENAVYIMRRGGSVANAHGPTPACTHCQGQQAARGRGRPAIIRAQSPEGESFYGTAPPAQAARAARFNLTGQTAPMTHEISRDWRYPVPSDRSVPTLPVEMRGAQAGMYGMPQHPAGPALPGATDYGLNPDTQGMASPDQSGFVPPRYGPPGPGFNPGIGGYSPMEGDRTVDHQGSVRIPLRLNPGEQPNFTEQDILLYDGDVVFVDSRDNEFFYTGGLLGGGQFNLPRDYDLDVLDAIAISEGHYGRNFINRPTKALGGVSILNKDVTAGASQVVVFRKLADGNEIPIKIDLKRALQDPGERLAIQPGDRIVLEYTRCEAIGAFLERHLFEGFLIGAATTFLYNK